MTLSLEIRLMQPCRKGMNMLISFFSLSVIPYPCSPGPIQPEAIKQGSLPMWPTSWTHWQEGKNESGEVNRSEYPDTPVACALTYFRFQPKCHIIRGFLLSSYIKATPTSTYPFLAHSISLILLYFPPKHFSLTYLINDRW